MCPRCMRLIMLAVIVFTLFLFVCSVVSTGLGGRVLESFAAVPEFDDPADTTDGASDTCIGSCPARNRIGRELTAINDNITALRLEQGDADAQISEMQEVINLLMDKHQDMAADAEASADIQRESIESMKSQKAVASADAGAKIAIGSPSPAELAVKLKKSPSEQMADLQKNPPHYTDAELDEHNKKVGKMFDDGKVKGVNAANVVNPTLNKNSAACVCPSKIESTDPGLGRSLLEQADAYGQKKCGKPPKWCSKMTGGPLPKPQHLKYKNNPKCTCHKRFASMQLKQLAQEYGCEAKNPMGGYPSSKKEMNKASATSRPTGYSFPT